MKRLTIFIATLLLLSSLAVALTDLGVPGGNYGQRNFIDENDAAINVSAILAECDNNNCDNIGNVLANESGDSSYTIRLPYTETSEDYVVFAFAPGYAPKAIMHAGNSNQGGSGSFGDYTSRMNKIQNCAAPLYGFSMNYFDIENRRVLKGNPITVNISTRTSGNVTSAFTDAGQPPFDILEGYDDYYSSEVDVVLEIYDYKNDLVNRTVERVNLFMDTVEQIQFTGWTPNMAAAGYVARISSVVVDDQCDASTRITELWTDTFTVSEPDEELCATTVENIRYTDMDGNLVNKLHPNNDYLVHFDRLSNYRDPAMQLNPIDTTMAIFITDDEAGTYVPGFNPMTITYSATGGEHDLDTHSFQWTPANEGNHTIVLYGVGSDLRCTDDLTNDVRRLSHTKTILSEGEKTAHFVAIDRLNGNRIQGVRLNFDGNEQFTDSDGEATFAGFTSGDYQLVATHPDFVQTNMEITIANVNLENKPVYMDRENAAPTLSEFQDVTLTVGVPTVYVDLDDMVIDTNHRDDELEWSWTGNSDVTITQDADNVLTLTGTTGWVNNFVTFTVTDPNGASDEEVIQVTIIGVNEAPTFDLPHNITLDEDTQETIDLRDYASDYETVDDNLVFTYVVSDNNICGVGRDSKAVLRVNPPAHFSGQCTATVTVTDEGGNSTTDNMEVVVTQVNDAPRIGTMPIDVVISVGDSWTYTVGAYDEDLIYGDSLTYSVSGPFGMSIGPASGVILYTATAAGEYEVDVTVTDLAGASDSQSFNLTVLAAPNNEPTVSVNLTPDLPTTDDDLVCTGLVSDGDGDTVTVDYTIRGGHDEDGTADCPGNVCTVNIPSTVTDYGETIICTMTPHDGTEYGSPGDDQVVIANGTATCGDGIIDPAEDCDDGNIDDGDGCSATCTLEPAVCGNGIIESGEECDDANTNNGDGCSSTCQTETSINQPPAFTTACPVDADIAQLFTYDANAVDPEDDALNYGLVNEPAGMTIVAASGVVDWTPDTLGVYNFNVTVTDYINTVGQACILNVNSVCGDDATHGAEVCDGIDLNGETCVSQGYDGGALACAVDCSGYDVSACTTAAVCGDDLRENPEVCDGTDLNGETCVSQGFLSGTLGCAVDCSGYDTSACVGDAPVTATIVASTTTGYAPLTVDFSAIVTGNAPFTYVWDLDGDGLADSTSATPSFTYTSSGAYTVTLTVTDSDGDIDVDTEVINVNTGALVISEVRINGDLIAMSDIYNVDLGDSIDIDVTVMNGYPAVSGIEIEDIEVALEIEDIDAGDSYDASAAEFDLDAGDDNTVTFSYTVPYSTIPGTYDALIDVEGEDELGNDLDDLFNFDLSVGDTAASAIIMATPSSGEAPLEVDFSAVVTGDGSITYFWDLDGDGLTDSNSPTPSYTYTQVGEHMVSLTIVDGDGDIGMDTQKITVTAVETPSVEKTPRDKLKIDNLRIIEGEVLSPGEVVRLHINFMNDGVYDMDGASITAVVPELGIKKKIGPFDVEEGDSVSRSLILEIPEWAPEGSYEMRVTISDDNTRRVKFRSFTIR